MEGVQLPIDHIDQLIKLALDEDIGEKDITTDAIVDPTLKAHAKIIAKEHLVVAGLDIAKHVFQTLDKEIIWDSRHEDGDHVEAKKVLASVEGRVSTLLSAERTVLNFLQHLSGIATATNIFVKTVSHTKVKILDTRKTTPGMRALEKHAVLMGHGFNHRMGLYDRYLIKNNHITIAGSISEAIARVKSKKRPETLVEVEASTLEDVRKAVECGVDIIMLDNMSIEEIKEAVKIVSGTTKIEASGNITLNNIIPYALTGIDFISIGAITHSAPAADIHMLMEI